MPWGVRWTFVSWANSFVGTQSCPTPPDRFAGRADSTRPWYVRVLNSKGREMFIRDIFDAFQGTKEGLSHGQTCRIQNPNIPRAGRVGVHSEVAGRGRSGLDANRRVRLGDKPLSYFQNIV